MKKNILKNGYSFLLLIILIGSTSCMDTIFGPSVDVRDKLDINNKMDLFKDPIIKAEILEQIKSQRPDIN